MSRFRRTSLPPEVRSGLRLERGERVLAHAAGDGGVLVATTGALHLPGGHRVPWERIDRARWDDEGLRFTEEGSGEHVFPVAEPGRLPEVVHERVTSTIVAGRHVPLPGAGGAGFRLVARRPPGGSRIDWRIHLDEGVDPGDPRVRAEAERALALIREQTGI
ncbi:hypothetical protein [Nocardiopsis potens]|uniref:hypothetical protein n=1 Tax=Nocardiopsis potens TaxID=1246458 RepID=UPI000477F13C|nr:hypothetical protein [Nocardiopsis potens]